MFLLAVACLETSVELDPNVRQQVLDKAATLIPPKDDDQVRMISKAGLPAVDLLTYKSEYSPSQAAYCVNTLALIGGDKAVAALAEYARQEHLEVSQALSAAWDKFDRKKYAELVLSLGKVVILDKLISWEGLNILQTASSLLLIIQMLIA